MFDMNIIFGQNTPQLQDFRMLWSDYYKLLSNKLVALNEIAFSSGIFGHSEENVDYYDQINNFHYLFLYLYNIRLEYQTEYALYEAGLIDELVTLTELAEYYKLDCIRKTMACYEFNMMIIYDLFGLNWHTDNEQDGIGFMAITPNSSVAPDNRVF